MPCCFPRHYDSNSIPSRFEVILQESLIRWPLNKGHNNPPVVAIARGSVAATMLELAGRTLVKVLFWIKLETITFCVLEFIYRAKCVCKHIYVCIYCLYFKKLILQIHKYCVYTYICIYIHTLYIYTYTIYINMRYRYICYMCVCTNIFISTCSIHIYIYYSICSICSLQTYIVYIL